MEITHLCVTTARLALTFPDATGTLFNSPVVRS